jgi:steroid delta-isomerase-like uncharacterized protein
MLTEQNKALERRIFAEMNKGNWAIVDELFAADYVYRTFGGVELRGREAFKQFLIGFDTAFPGFHMGIEDMIAEGDKVVTRTTISGTHKGDFRGLAPTGRQISLMGILIARFVDGKEVEAWELADDLSLRQQLGIAPPAAQPGK